MIQRKGFVLGVMKELRKSSSGRRLVGRSEKSNQTGPMERSCLQVDLKLLKVSRQAVEKKKLVVTASVFTAFNSSDAGEPFPVMLYTPGPAAGDAEGGVWELKEVPLLLLLQANKRSRSATCVAHPSRRDRH